MTNKRIAIAGDWIQDQLIPDRAVAAGDWAQGTHTESQLEDRRQRTTVGGAGFLTAMVKGLLDDVEIVCSPPAQPGFDTTYRLKKLPQTIRQSRNSVYRWNERICDGPATAAGQEKWPLFQNKFNDNADLLLVADHSRYAYLSRDWKTSIESWLEREDGLDLRVVAMIAGDLPNPFIESKKPDPLWELLLRGNNADRVVAIVGLDSLRQQGAGVSRLRSWDRTIDDFVEELERFKPLMELSRFAHTVVRVGIVGAFHVFRDPDAKKGRATARSLLLRRPC